MAVLHVKHKMLVTKCDRWTPSEARDHLFLNLPFSTNFYDLKPNTYVCHAPTSTTFRVENNFSHKCSKKGLVFEKNRLVYRYFRDLNITYVKLFFKLRLP